MIKVLGLLIIGCVGSWVIGQRVMAAQDAATKAEYVYQATNYEKKTKALSEAQKDAYPSFFRNAEPNQGLGDSWGFLVRSCQSWVAFKAWAVYGYNLSAWDNNVSRWHETSQIEHLGGGTDYRVEVNNQPEANSALYQPNAGGGHAAWVERVNLDGTIHISEYNGVESFGYSERDIAPDGLTFFHFNGRKVDN